MDPRVLDAVVAYPGLADQTKLTLVSIIRCFGGPFVTIHFERLAEARNKELSTIYRHIKELCKDGFLRYTSVPGQYQVNLSPLSLPVKPVKRVDVLAKPKIGIKHGFEYQVRAGVRRLKDFRETPIDDWNIDCWTGFYRFKYEEVNGRRTAEKESDLRKGMTALRLIRQLDRSGASPHKRFVQFIDFVLREFPGVTIGTLRSRKVVLIFLNRCPELDATLRSQTILRRETDIEAIEREASKIVVNIK